MNPQFEQAQQLGNLWLEMMTKMMAAAVSMDPTQPPPVAARHLSDISLAAMGQQADKYMRSPQFLAMVKESLDAQIAFRKQLNDFFTDAHHSVKGVAQQDVDALSQSIRQLERRVLNRIESVCDRLEQVSRRLEALESDGDGSGGAAKGDNNGHSKRRGAEPAKAPAAEPGME